MIIASKFDGPTFSTDIYSGQQKDKTF